MGELVAENINPHWLGHPMVYEKHATHAGHQWSKGCIRHAGKLDYPEQSAPHTHAQRQQHDRCEKLAPPRHSFNRPELCVKIESNPRDWEVNGFTLPALPCLVNI